MEKRESPPKFDLAGSHQSTEAFRRALKDEHHCSKSLLGSPQSVNEASSIAQGEDGQTHFGILAHDNANASMTQKGVKPTEETLDDCNAASLPNPSSFEPSYGTGQVQLDLSHLTLPQANLPALLPINSFGWQYSGFAPPLPFGQEQFDGVEPTTRLLVSSQNCLAQAEVHFCNLDRQLKAIDRHRAMSHHDPSLAAQRYAIVGKRSEAKELVTRLVAHVEALQSLTGPLVDATSSSALMGGAQPFVPQVVVPSSAGSSRPPTTGGSFDLSVETDRSFADKQPFTANKRKIIPIVAPPSRLVSDGLALARNLASSPTVGEDPWRPGHRSSSDAANQGPVRQRTAPKSKSHTEPLSAAQGVAGSASNHLSSDAEGHQIIRWANGRPGSLPAGLEAWTELYYDALRLPEGVITIFTLEDDVCFEVCGARLGYPGPGELSSTERTYWDKKPVLTKAILEELRSKADIVDDSTYGDDYLLGYSSVLAADRNDAIDDSGSLHSDEGGVQLQPSANMQDLLEEAIKFEAGRRRQTASAPQPVPALSSDENRAGPDAELSNKGYTSVSTQSINATVRLPPSFDGTTENKSQTARAVLTAAKKARSPRVLHRSSPQGGAWYGPHCRKLTADGS